MRRALLTGFVLLAVLVPASASAAGGNAVINDCNLHGKLTRHYSVAALRNALAALPPASAAYTNCPDVIRIALNQDLSHHSGSGAGAGSGGSFLPAWVIVVLIVVILGGAGATVAARRRRDGGDGPGTA